MSAPRASLIRFSETVVSPEKTIEPSALSKRYANDGKVGAWGTRIARTLTFSSSYTSIGSMSGAGFEFAPVTIGDGNAMSCAWKRVSSAGRRSSRMRSLMSAAYARSRYRVISTVPGVGSPGLCTGGAGSGPNSGGRDPRLPGPYTWTTCGFRPIPLNQLNSHRLK
jgi:hypothetical protein